MQLHLSLFLIALLTCATQAQETQEDWETVSELLGREGKLNADGSYKVSLPRADISVEGRLGFRIPPAMGLSSFAAFAGSLDGATVVGDTCMLEHEVNPVIDRLRAGNIEVVALHNHMLSDKPRLFFLHFQGRGDTTALARTIRSAWDELGKPAPKEHEVAEAAQPKKPDWKQIAEVFGKAGAQAGEGVRKYTRPRSDLVVELDGHRLPAGIGLTSWAAFYGCPCGQTMVMGDTVVTRDELQGAIEALRKGGVRITAIHNHFLGERTQVAFMHIEAEGMGVDIARAVRAAWDRAGR